MTQVTAGGVVVLVIVAVVVVGVIALTHSSKSSAKAAGVAELVRRDHASGDADGLAVGDSATPSATPVTEPATHCTYTSQTASLAATSALPPSTPDFKATYQATINTNRGAIVIDLLNSKATCTVNSFVFLAQKSFFNNTPCHRLTDRAASSCCSAVTRPEPAPAALATSSPTRT